MWLGLNYTLPALICTPVVLIIDVCIKQEVAGGGDFDRAAMTVACEEAGYSEIPGDLPQSVTTVDLSNNIIERLEPLSRLQHVVNLRLRGNRISRIRDIPSASPGTMRVDEKNNLWLETDK